MRQQWTESIIISIYIKDDKTDCNNYRGISLTNYMQNFIQYSMSQA